MSSDRYTINDVKDTLAATQALIDQARQHLADNTNRLSEESVILVEAHLNERQLKLDMARIFINSRFPK